MGQMNEVLCKVIAHNLCVLIACIHEIGLDVPSSPGWLPLTSLIDSPRGQDHDYAMADSGKEEANQAKKKQAVKPRPTRAQKVKAKKSAPPLSAHRRKLAHANTHIEEIERLVKTWVTDKSVYESRWSPIARPTSRSLANHSSLSQTTLNSSSAIHFKRCGPLSTILRSHSPSKTGPL